MRADGEALSGERTVNSRRDPVNGSTSALDLEMVIRGIESKCRRVMVSMMLCPISLELLSIFGVPSRAFCWL